MKTTQVQSVGASWQVCALFVLAAAAVMMPDLALAVNNDTPMGNVMCTVKGWFTGNTGKGLATIAITIIGIGALLGKVSWGTAIIVGMGVAIVFGAAGIVDAMNAGAAGTSVGASNCDTTANPT